MKKQTRNRLFAKALGLSLVASLAATAAQAQTAIGGGKNPSFPITISKSGSYKLVNNLNVPAGLDGIVLAPGVDATIDLGSFTIKGPAECSKYVNCFQFDGTVGVRVQEGQILRISNGTVTGFTAAGVGAPGGFNFSQVNARDLRVIGNGIGIRAYALMVDHVVANDNWGTGVYGETGSILDSIAFSNGGGFAISLGTIRGCVARANTNYGFSFQRTTNENNVTFDNGVPTQGGGAYSPGLNNGYND